MVQRSKRSMSAGKAREIQAETRKFHLIVRRWCGEIPVSNEIYIALDVLNFALHLANSRLNMAAGSNEADQFHGMYRMDIDAGEE